MNSRFFLFNATAINVIGLLYIFLFGFQNNVENFIYSLFYRPENVNTDNILIVDLDDQTLKEIDMWPIPRDYFVKVLEKSSKSRAIIFDIIFSENSEKDSLLLPYFRKLSNRIVMPVVIKDGELLWPNEEIREAVRFLGTPSVIVENNGFVFRIPVLEKGGNGYYYSISLLAAYLSNGIEPYELMKKYGDEIYFSIPREKPKHVSLYDFINDSANMDLRNKIVFIGSSATGVGDLFTLPTGDIVSGVEVHSYATASIIDGKLKKLVNPFRMFIIYFILSLMLLVIFNEVPFIIWFVASALYAASVFIIIYIKIHQGLLIPGFFMLIPLLYIVPIYTFNFHVQILLSVLNNFRKLAGKIALEREIPRRFPGTSDIYSMNYEDLSSNLDYISDYIDREIQLIRQIANTIKIGIMIENSRGKVLFKNRQFLKVNPSRQELSRGILEKDGRIYRIDLIESDHFRIYTLSDVTHEERQARDYKLLFRMLNHEIRTPLNVVLGYWDLFKFRGTLEKDKQGKIERAFQTITNILDGFTLIARSKAGLVNKPGKRIMLDRVSMEILNSLRMEYSRKDLQIESKCEKSIVKTDPLLLRVILKNLIENALKYAKSRIILICKGNRFIIANDTNLPEKEIVNIFEPFYRGRDAGNVKGLGLGMTIVRELCNALDIHIKVDYDRAIGGIRITLTFPEDEEGSE